MSKAGLYVGVFLVAMSVLLFQVALTRVFSLMMWFHFAYLVVSLALLGFGAAGSVLTLRREAERTEDPLPRLARLASAYGATVIVSFLFVTSLRIDALAVRLDLAPFVALFLCFVTLAVPFLLGGLAIGLALTRFRQIVGRVYFVDLLGSAVGGAVSGLLLSRVGPTGTIVLAGLLGLLAGLGFALSGRWSARLAHGCVALAGVAVSMSFLGGFGLLPAIEWSIPYAPDKEVRVGSPDGKPALVLESATAQVEVGDEQYRPISIYGEVGALGQNEMVWGRLVTQDGTAPTFLFADAAQFERFAFLDDLLPAAGQIAWRAEGRSEADVLVIGVGGGVDVLMSLAFGARSVRGVEMNPAMVRALRDEFADYADGLFEDPRVELITAEGRSFLRRDTRRYDIIQMSGVDTYAALASGAYTLSESYLYTVEALEDLYARLAEGGLINCSRFFLGVPRTPRETIRYANVAREALARSGVAEPWRHIAVFQGFHWGSTLIKKEPFTEQECRSLDEFARRQGFMGLVHDPSRPTGERSAGTGWARLRREEAVGMLAVLSRFRPRAIQGLVNTVVVSEVETAFAEAAGGDSAGARARRQRLVQSADVAIHEELGRAIEAGWDESIQLIARSRARFVEVQANFETLLRGSEAQRRALVARYPFDLEPSTDDSPFFFNYYRLSHWRAAREDEPTGSYLYLPSLPVGHGVLLGSLILITLLAAVLILWPLRRLGGRGESGPRLRTFGYFAALGLGYMFVEIAVMQKFVLFLGHPTTSLSIVLPALLLGSGFGALVSGRVREPTPRVARRLMLGIFGSLVILIAAIAWILEPLLGLPFPARVAVAVALVLPVGFVLGFPFPLGLRRLDRSGPSLVPWAWAINGFLSVFSAMFATIVAMGFGFTVVLASAVVVYLVGFAIMDWGEESRAG